MSLTIRPYQDTDAPDIAALYNRHRDNPNPVAGGITGAQLGRELAERNTALFLVAVEDGQLVGTFGLFHTTGRRTARTGELIADMFFVAPAHRNGLLTGRLFTEAVEWMVGSGCLVLRLTVNPANSVAFRLYRRVGCVSVGRTVPGEDGNVELHNYIPLILRSVFADLGDEAKAALGGLSSFATVAGGRDDELRTDITVLDGARTVAHTLSLGDFRLAACVDVDRGAVRAATLTGPGGSVRELRLTPPPQYARTAVPAAPYRFGEGALSAELDAADGTLRVWADGHHGPVFVSTWPACRAGSEAGWREGEPRDLEITPREAGLRVVERCGEDRVTGEITLVGGVLEQAFTHTRTPGRIFQNVGLRQGYLEYAAGERHPLGTGLGVRDASEVVAAGHEVPAGTGLTWGGAHWTVGLTAEAPLRLVHGTLLERRAVPGADGVSRLRTVFRNAAASTETGPAGTAAAAGAACAPSGPRTLELRVTAGGVTAWKEGAVRVLRSPYPRSRVFGCNPRWTAGMWVTGERGRADRAGGLGWGVRPSGGWEEKGPRALYAPADGTGWEVHAPEDPVEPVRVAVRGRPQGLSGGEPGDRRGAGADEARDTVLWLTPHTPQRTSVVFESAGTRWERDSSQFRQVWADALSLRLTDGGWLHCRPAPGAPRAAELVLRTTSAGLLVGCATPTGTDADWHLSVHDAPLT
ncbi:GNAT family N-acetyltransferase [Streptomyces cremeus]|uniref:GNAT family N-acetyltransferase n=1 Tax=Streptomyces cremeus TaxID=66881 RepID=A0ABV5PLP4_STRCM